MIEKTYTTKHGTVHYWINEIFLPSRDTLVFLPGLTADHRLFEKQVLCFESKYNVLVWDAPGHNRSRPFDLTFSLMDKARWLEAILSSNDL